MKNVHPLLNKLAVSVEKWVSHLIWELFMKNYTIALISILFLLCSCGADEKVADIVGGVIDNQAPIVPSGKSAELFGNWRRTNTPLGDDPFDLDLTGNSFGTCFDVDGTTFIKISGTQLAGIVYGYIVSDCTGVPLVGTYTNISAVLTVLGMNPKYPAPEGEVFAQP